MQNTIERNDAEANALRAFSANGFGDAAIESTDVYDTSAGGLGLKARADRAYQFVELVAASLKAVADFARNLAADLKRRQHARATYLALRDLDARILRDLGFDRSELMSVAAELAGNVIPTRTRFASAG